MQLPENTDDENTDDKNTDNKIKELFLSSDPADWVVGLRLLYNTYRDEISGYIRRWNKTSLFSLTSQDLKEIWPNTLRSIAENVAEGKFKSNGNLRVYVRTIAYRRAVDLLRGILRLAKVSDESCDRVVRPPAVGAELLEVIQKLVRQLPESLRVVIEVDIELFLGQSKWPSIDQLTEEVNRRISGEPLTKSAVKGRRARGRKRLRDLGDDDIGFSK